QELETAIRLGHRLVVLILQDDAYGMIRWKQAVNSYSDFGMTFGNPDFVKYAEAYGQQEAGMRIEPAPSLASAIGTKREAMAAAAPPLDPPGMMPSCHGFFVVP
ncbi:hypothetical protein EN822_26930, partial [bacterium M00.F.Ca.ET.179.01.1.1]